MGREAFYFVVFYSAETVKEMVFKLPTGHYIFRTFVAAYRLKLKQQV